MVRAGFRRIRSFSPVGSHVIAGLFFFMLGMLWVDRAGAADPTGIWLVEDRDAEVQIATCGKELCATVVWIQQPNDPASGKPWVDKNNVDASKRSRPLLGLTIATDMKPGQAAGHWTGQIYSVVHGRNYDGSITLLSLIKLKFEGCWMQVICQSEIWTKQIDGGNAARLTNSIVRRRRG